VPTYLAILCPKCKRTFWRVEYGKPLKATSCPWCSRKIDLERERWAVLKKHELPSLRR